MSPTASPDRARSGSRRARWIAAIAGAVTLVAAAMLLLLGAGDVVGVPFVTDGDAPSGAGLALLAAGAALGMSVPFVMAAVSGAGWPRGALALVAGVAIAVLVDVASSDRAVEAAGAAIIAGTVAAIAIALPQGGRVVPARVAAIVVVAIVAALAFSRHAEYGMLAAFLAIPVADDIAAR